MGNGEVDTPTKTPKAAVAQEQQQPSSPVTVYPDWASFQAYYNSAGTPIPPHGFFHSPVPSNPQGHPYMWGRHMMPPYGTPPPPYVTMYPHGGLYGHPSMPPGSHPYAPYAMPSPNGTAEASVAAAGVEMESKSVEGNKRNPLKKSKGSLGSLSMLTGKGDDTGKTSGASTNGGVSQSGESGNEGSSEGSDANSQNGSQKKTLCEHGSSTEEGHNGTAYSGVSGSTGGHQTQTTVTQNMATMAMPPNGAAGPTTNLNIGMDYWGGSTPSVSTVQSKLATVSSKPAIVPTNLIGSRGGSSDLWLQDERELKRQRRKQSNRESARRSRLRKQAECEELAQRVDTLKAENGSLREELEHMREQCQKLATENASLNERLEKQQQESGANGIPK